MASIYGLDIGTNAVRVAEIEPGEPPRLRAFGQVALPPDAMHEGEVANGAAVAAALQRLWRELGLRKRADVRVGVASPRVILRPVDLPAMPEGELAGALRFQAQELIPIPIDDARIDFQVQETFTSADGQPVNRLLLTAAHRDTVDRLRASVEAAQLRVRAVDLVPLALVRGVGRMASFDQPAVAEAIVSLGAGMTVVVVHERGVTRFARMLASAGRALTDAIASTMGIDQETAEALKRHVAEAPADQIVQASEAMERPLEALCDEVRGSLDYYRTQAGAVPISRVLLTGGTALVPGIRERLEGLVGVPVEMAQPRAALVVDDLGFPEDQLPLLDPYLAVPVGIALGGLPSLGRQIDLLGGVVRPAGDGRRIALLSAGIGLVLVGGLGFLSWQRMQELDDARRDKAEQAAANRAVQQDIDELAAVQQTQSEIEAARAPIEQILAADVSWSGVLTDLAIATPADSWLTAFQGTLVTATGTAEEAAPPPESPTTSAGSTTSSAPAAETAPAAPTIAGELTFSGTAIGFQAVSDWITQYSMVRSFTSIWVPNATRSVDTGLVEFSANATLTPDSRSRRLECLDKLEHGETCEL